MNFLNAILNAITMWLRSKLGSHSIAGTRCRWCDAWILKNPWHAPIPLCEPCFKFAWHHRKATVTMQLDCFNAEAKMWIYLMQRSEGSTPEQIIEGEKKDVAQALVSDDEELERLQYEIGRAINRGDKVREKEVRAEFRERLTRSNPLRKLQKQLGALAEEHEAEGRK